VPTVKLAGGLYRFFPALAGRTLDVEASTAAEVVRAVESLAPGFAGYVVDERGRLRPHVNVFVDGSLLLDRQALSDRVPAGGTVHILQALTGG
jgi:predicted phage tail protein